ncbi:GNAT family N-acetyltransferase [Vibrio sp. OCN044]|uniref:GNAT family N-acetyltransferase n=1 Tax=Vibrio tetraodonis subsp. pristinus TaxID=2695891 RepID=A0A6L8LRM1_9VIBR|nr:GNAT family N-acetyltransferase [Vibrio tetraodonis]MYM58678.1 GNAT family N-acetyltransferase [Vibrio tetraodonis subsp. pristinus]
MYQTRKANDNDYRFLFELKKSAEYEAVKAVFGWDESVQKEIHRNEWEEERPTIIEVEGVPVGSYLLQLCSDYYYFGRFFLLPEYQSKGIGSQVLESITALSGQKSLPIKLCYLKGNRVGELYERFGFVVTEESEDFVYMFKSSE